ncbi:hypothetical protein G5I_05094 [Acromyrmex echinatior]|uniref:Uncharacterized protein n=1 Tax=Acromyrmex echinatior TaxID=103372 RepID=F4WHD4_ACREC|nr:hypothetical protein G5I_05094 [Acromyrmex echinatior]
MGLDFTIVNNEPTTLFKLGYTNESGMRNADSGISMDFMDELTETVEKLSVCIVNLRQKRCPIKNTFSFLKSVGKRNKRMRDYDYKGLPFKGITEEKGGSRNNILETSLFTGMQAPAVKIISRKIFQQVKPFYSQLSSYSMLKIHNATRVYTREHIKFDWDRRGGKTARQVVGVFRIPQEFPESLPQWVITRIRPRLSPLVAPSLTIRTMRPRGGGSTLEFTFGSPRAHERDESNAPGAASVSLSNRFKSRHVPPTSPSPSAPYFQPISRPTRSATIARKRSRLGSIIFVASRASRETRYSEEGYRVQIVVRVRWHESQDHSPKTNPVYNVKPERFRRSLIKYGALPRARVLPHEFKACPERTFLLEQYQKRQIPRLILKNNLLLRF